MHSRTDRSGNAAARSRRVRTAYRLRESRTGNGDIAYLLYAVLLVIVTAISPLVRAIVLELRSESVQEVVTSVVASGAGIRIGVAMVGIALASFAALGAVRGPVAPTPFFVTILADAPGPRSATLGHSFRVALAIGVLLGAAVGALLGATWGGFTAVWVGAGLGALGAVPTIWIWLAGQLLESRAWVLATALVGVSGLGAWALSIEILNALDWRAQVWGMGALLGMCVLMLMATPALLRRLSSRQLLAQAYAWETVGAAAGLGDFATALGSLRAKPAAFRRVRAVRTLLLPALFMVRDLIGAIRTPARFSVSCIGPVLCQFGGLTMLAQSTSARTDSAQWAICAAAALGCYFALSGVTDGFRHAAESAGTTAQYGMNTRTLYLLHSLFPLVLGLVTVGLAWGLSMLMGSHPQDLGKAILGGAVGVCVIVAARAYDSLKGPMPVVLATTPISSPAGDPGIIFQLVWRADALLLATAGGAAALHFAITAASSGVWISICVLAWCAYGIHRRIARAG
ncbi:MAG: hypothetical protein ACTIJ6_04050 [Leucobacter sp.]